MLKLSEDTTVAKAEVQEQHNAVWKRMDTIVQRSDALREDVQQTIEAVSGKVEAMRELNLNALKGKVHSTERQVDETDAIVRRLQREVRLMMLMRSLFVSCSAVRLRTVTAV